MKTHNLKPSLLALTSAVCLWSLTARAVAPTELELAEAGHWAAAKFKGLSDSARPGAGRKPLTAEPPFAFTYDGKPSAELLKQWKTGRASRDLDAERVAHTLTYTDERTGLEVRCEAVAYRDFPTVEWTVYFKNTGLADTPVLADVLALDLDLERPGKGEFVLHHFTGSPCPGKRFRAVRDDSQAGGGQAHHRGGRTPHQ